MQCNILTSLYYIRNHQHNKIHLRSLESNHGCENLRQLKSEMIVKRPDTTSQNANRWNPQNTSKIKSESQAFKHALTKIIKISIELAVIHFIDIKIK